MIQRHWPNWEHGTQYIFVRACKYTRIADSSGYLFPSRVETESIWSPNNLILILFFLNLIFSPLGWTLLSMRRDDTRTHQVLGGVIRDLDGPGPAVLVGRPEPAISGDAEEALSILLRLKEESGFASITGLARHAVFCLARMAFETAQPGEEGIAMERLRAPFAGLDLLSPEGEPEELAAARDRVLFDRARALTRLLIRLPGHSKAISEVRSWMWTAR